MTDDDQEEAAHIILSGFCEAEIALHAKCAGRWRVVLDDEGTKLKWGVIRCRCWCHREREAE